MSETFTLERLQKLCEDRDWLAAEREAKEIAWICRHNHNVLHPPVYLRKPPPCRWQPSQRICAVLRRLSRNRIIEAKEARELAHRMARKWSGNSGNTMRAFDHLYRPGRYWRGQWRGDWLERYEDLTSLARKNGWQWCDLKRHAYEVRMRALNLIGREQANLAETRAALKDLNKAIRERRAA